MAENRTIKANTQHTRAQFDVSTFNEENRTVEVTAATERAVRMFDYDSWETVDEILGCTPEECDLNRLNSGAPLLDNHIRDGKTSKAVVGVVERAWFAEGQLRALVRFKKSEEATELMNDVRDGFVKGVSLGYNVFEYQVTRTEGQRAKYRATKWESFEISFTPVQADVDSRVRSNEPVEHEINITEETTADLQEKETTAVEGEHINNNQNDNIMADTAEDIKPDAKALEQERSQAKIAERQRAKDIRELGKLRAFNGVPATFFEELADSDVSVEVARERAIEEFEKLNPITPKPMAANDTTDADKKRSAMANALTLRINPSAAKDIGDENVRAAADYRGMSFLRFAEQSLLDANVNTRNLSAREIATVALGGKVRGLHHTTDFPLLLMDTVNRTLLAQYLQQERTFTSWARRASMSDFRPVTRARLSEIFGGLELVREGEEYKYGSITESGETYKLAKYGKIIGITWEAIVNDDLSAFNRLPQSFAASAAILQSEIVYGILISNPTMADNNALFSAAHNNFVGTAGSLTAGGTALSEASLIVALQKFRTQKNEAGQFIRVTPKFLIVGPLNEVMAGKLTSANYTPNVQANQPVQAFTGLTVVVDPQIEGYTWFLSAAPEAVDTVEYAFLDGEEELFIEQREGFNIEGVEVKARMVFAAKAIDWRGLFRNNGAAQA